MSRTVAHEPAITEAELQDGVIELARYLGWRVAHFRPALTRHGWRTPVQADGTGFPDLILVRGPRLLAVELKVAYGKVTEEQQAWLDSFACVEGADAFVWRPGDWHDGTIETVLR